MRFGFGRFFVFGFALCAGLAQNCKSAPAKTVETQLPPQVAEPQPVARTLPAPEQMQVAVLGELALRVAPGRKSNFIRAIPYGATVEVIDRFGPDDVARGVEGKWYKVAYAGRTGWAFGGFLREVDEQHRYRIGRRRAVRIE